MSLSEADKYAYDKYQNAVQFIKIEVNAKLLREKYNVAFPMQQRHFIHTVARLKQNLLEDNGYSVSIAYIRAPSDQLQLAIQNRETLTGRLARLDYLRYQHSADRETLYEVQMAGVDYDLYWRQSHDSAPVLVATKSHDGGVKSVNESLWNLFLYCNGGESLDLDPDETAPDLEHLP